MNRPSDHSKTASLPFALELLRLSGLLPPSLFREEADIRSAERTRCEAIRLAALHVAACVEGFAREDNPLFGMRDILAPWPDYFENPVSHSQIVGAAEIRHSWRQLAGLAKRCEQPEPPLGLSDELREWLFYGFPHLSPTFVVLEMNRLAGAAWARKLDSFENVAAPTGKGNI